MHLPLECRSRHIACETRILSCCQIITFSIAKTFCHKGNAFIIGREISLRSHKYELVLQYFLADDQVGFLVFCQQETGNKKMRNG
jgi:hypothetical protein